MDPTEDIRRKMVKAFSDRPRNREELKEQYGEVWDTTELQKEFEVSSFLAPFVLVKRKSSGKIGTVIFQHLPRFYFAFEADRDD